MNEPVKTTTLKPGFLVAFKTSITGNVAYKKTVLEGEHQTADGAEQARWETERTVKDPVENAAAKKARGAACAAIRRVCIQSQFGLLCPDARADELEAAIKEARAAAAKFNDGAKVTRLSVYAICGKVAPDDAEAVRAINSEIRELMQMMEDGVRDLDVRAVRDAAARAKGLGTMLAADAQAEVVEAVSAARAAATKMAKDKVADKAASVDLAAASKIAGCRALFADEGAEVAAPEVRGRALAPEPAGAEG